MKKHLLLLLLPLLVFSCSSQSEKEDLKNVRPAEIGFYETYSSAEVQPLLKKVIDWTDHNDSIMKSDYFVLITDLGSMITPISDGSAVVALVDPLSLSTVERILDLKPVKALLPNGMKFMLSAKPSKTYSEKVVYELYTIKVPEDGKAIINGKHIGAADAEEDEERRQVYITLNMTQEGQQLWGKMTADNIGKNIAITLDGMVMSCPMVMNAITSGSTQISGNFTLKEAEDLARGIRAGR